MKMWSADEAVTVRSVVLQSCASLRHQQFQWRSSGELRYFLPCELHACRHHRHGPVTPVGNDVDDTWAALLAGRSGAAPITLFDASGFSTRIAAEVKDFDAERAIAERKLLKFANRSHRFALAAAEQAMRDAGIAPTAATRRAGAARSAPA